MQSKFEEGDRPKRGDGSVSGEGEAGGGEGGEGGGEGGKCCGSGAGDGEEDEGVRRMTRGDDIFRATPGACIRLD